MIRSIQNRLNLLRKNQMTFISSSSHHLLELSSYYTTPLDDNESNGNNRDHNNNNKKLSNIDCLSCIQPKYLQIVSPSHNNHFLSPMEKPKNILNDTISNKKIEIPNQMSKFTETFRLMSPYINVHRGRTIVIHLSGELIDSKNFSSTIEDIALLHTFGIKLVIVAGSRPQLSKRMMELLIKSEFVSGLRITDARALQCAMDAAGSIRVKVESHLGRGLINDPHSSNTSISVSSGNYVTAQPLGVRGGTDYKYTGEVRRINVNKIKSALDSNDIVVMSNLGYSASGEVFNCMSEHVARKAAIQLNSDKLIFLHDGEELVDTTVDNNKIIRTLLLRDAQRYLDYFKHANNINNINDLKQRKKNNNFILYLQEAVKACTEGVRRAHLVSRHLNGGLLEELFTRDGRGLMVCKDMYEGIRSASFNDIVGIMRLIQPLLDKDVLVSRNQEQIEANVGTFTVVERDGAIIGCAALETHGEDFAEIACVAVDPSYKNSGRGNALLGFLLRKARLLNVKKVFVLTTRTSHWFLERGFEPADLDVLPRSKQMIIDKNRKSKIYIMDISHERTVDERELLLQV